MTDNNKSQNEELRNEDGTFTQKGAEEFGQRGGEAAQESGNAHQLTDKERAEGGKNSRSNDDNE